MPNQDALIQAQQRHRFAGRISDALRTAIQELKNVSALEGLELHKLPDSIDKAVHGFDLTFADRRVRLIFSGSNTGSGAVAIECLRVPVAYGSDYKILEVLFVDQNGSFSLPGENLARTINNPASVIDLICHLVEITNTLFSEVQHR